MKTTFTFCVFLFGCTSLFAQTTNIDSTAKAKPMPATNAQQVFTISQQPAKFPGDLNKWLADHIVYPGGVNTEGTVYVTFVVELDGSLSHIKVLRGLEANLDAEAIRVVTAMPKWKPAIQNGHTVSQIYNLPVKFKLPTK